jgi:hypothetical protein
LDEREFFMSFGSDLPPLPEPMRKFDHRFGRLTRTDWSSAALFPQTEPFRGRAYAAVALDRVVAELSDTPSGKRNETLNAVAFRMGRMIARDWLDEKAVIVELIGASEANGYLGEHGNHATMKTIESGIDAGKKQPHPDLTDRDPSGDGGSPSSKLSDLSDLSGTVGASRQSSDDEQLSRGRTAGSGTWDEPDWGLLDDQRGELPEFPVTALPASMHEWLLSAARGAGVTTGQLARHGQPNTRNGGTLCMWPRARRVWFGECGSTGMHPIDRALAAVGAGSTRPSPDAVRLGALFWAGVYEAFAPFAPAR